MWKRAELKSRAKLTLRGKYWKGVLAWLLMGVIVGAPLAIMYVVMMMLDMMVVVAFAGYQGDAAFSAGPTPAFIAAIVLLVIANLCLIFLYMILVALPLEAGLARYFNREASGRETFTDIFFAMKKGNYIGVTGGMAFYMLFTFLWTLLLIIPGYVKMYSYRMVPFILSDNPDIGARRALRLSIAMTKGHKWRMFVLDLSFLGWFLLAYLTFGIGIYFLMPYYYATQAELYATLRVQAVGSGLTTVEELRLV